MPISWKWIFFFSLAMSILFYVIGYGVFNLIEDGAYTLADESLQEQSEIIRDNNFDFFSEFQNRTNFSAGLLFTEGCKKLLFAKNGRFYVQLIDTSGRAIACSTNISKNLPISDRALVRAEEGGRTYETFFLEAADPFRILTVPIMSDQHFSGHLLQVAVRLGDSINLLQGIGFRLCLFFIFGLFLSILLGIVIVNQSLRSFRLMAKEAEKIGIYDLSKRLNVGGRRDEYGVLASAINGFLDRLEDSFKRMSRFPSDVSHELRTPLAAIKGEAELALRRIRTPEQYQCTLRLILKESDRMNSIVEDLLLLARAKANALQVKWESVDFNFFLKELQGSIVRDFSYKGVLLNIRNFVECRVYLSPVYFSLALKNILLNSCKYSRAGAWVELSARCCEGFLVINIIDCGCGIPKREQPYVFDLFYRADAARSRGVGGSGIGLSLAHELIKLHDGLISIESEHGTGTMVMVTIPLNRTIKFE